MKKESNAQINTRELTDIIREINVCREKINPKNDPNKLLKYRIDINDRGSITMNSSYAMKYNTQKEGMHEYLNDLKKYISQNNYE